MTFFAELQISAPSQGELRAPENQRWWEHKSDLPPLNVTLTDVLSQSKISALCSESSVRSLPALTIGESVQENAQALYRSNDPNVRLYDAARSAVVQIKTDKGAGSGCFISKDGLIITANHVVKDAKSIVVTSADGHDYVATVEKVDPTKDVASLRIKPIEGDKISALELRDTTKDLKNDQKIAFLGHPEGWNKVYYSPARYVSRHIANELNMDNYGRNPQRTVLEIQASTRPGSSGCPLVDEKGKLVGILNAGKGMSTYVTTAESLRTFANGTSSSQSLLPHSLYFGSGTINSALQSAISAGVMRGMMNGPGGFTYVGLGCATLDGVANIYADQAYLQGAVKYGSKADVLNAGIDVGGDLLMISSSLALVPRFRTIACVAGLTGSLVKFGNNLLSDRSY